LNEKLERLDCSDNPIYNLILSCYNCPINNMLINKILKIINKFHYLYYSLKFKKHFIKWLWKSREIKIMEKYHPKYLWENLEEKTDLDEFMEKW